MRKILPLLTQKTEGQPSFHVVTYSLLGFGFSEALKRKGFSLNQYAEVRLPYVTIRVYHILFRIRELQVGNKLMLSLGYKAYGRVQVTRIEHLLTMMSFSYSRRRLGSRSTYTVYSLSPCSWRNP